MNSILETIKKMLGGQYLGTHFDPDLIMHINTVFLVLNQLGVGPKTIYKITGSTETWDDFYSGVEVDMDAVISYVYLRVKMLFDPPTNGPSIEAYGRIIGELEWRMNVQVENHEMEQNGGDA